MCLNNVATQFSYLIVYFLSQKSPSIAVLELTPSLAVREPTATFPVLTKMRRCTALVSAEEG